MSALSSAFRPAVSLPCRKRVKSRSYRRSDHGYATLTVLVLVSLAVAAVLVVSTLAVSQGRLSRGVGNHVSALTMAESGIDDALNRIETVSINYTGTASDSAYTSSSGWVTLYDDHPNTIKKAGSFRTVVSTVAGQNYVRKVTSVGKSATGEQTTVIAMVQINTRRIGTAAIMANDGVDVSGGATVLTEPRNEHIADVFANGNISMGGSSFVDGRLEASGTVTGSAYYPSVQGSPKMTFPSKAETDVWKSDFITASNYGIALLRINPRHLDYRSGPVTITAPAYINGDVTLNNSESLVLSGASTTSVVYVNGDVKLTGSASITNGVRFVVSGEFEQGGSATYKVVTPPVTDPPTLSPSLLVFGGSVYGVNASANTTTVKLAGGSGTDSAGLVWALGGSIQVAGGSTFRGALVASQVGADVNSTGGYNHEYPTGLWYDKELPTNATVSAAIEP